VYKLNKNSFINGNNYKKLIYILINNQKFENEYLNVIKKFEEYN